MMRRMLAVCACVLLTSCGGEPPKRSADSVVPRDTVTVAPTAEPVAPLDSAARAVLAFLRGEGARIVLADTVELYVGKDAGGTSTAYPRALLANPAYWIARSSRGNFRFVPPATLVKLTVKPGAHFICTERKLAASFPQLAKRPHVGMKLEPDVGDSCLQTWNVTLVFDDSIRPRLVAAVYDQWEW